ncbi:MAG: hypothetical protein OXH90_03360 [Paracoccaceae bacterium]|nr:hypothetical protein [Paracoccaceae bacterium]MDE2916869.1 hypothetical protein [Paracoccaceae bacterium]
MNERKTENIVRNHLTKAKENYTRKTGYHVWIEEQQSDKPGIKKLLKKASKTGNGPGYPEFIITFENNNILLVIECKPDPNKLKSKFLDQPKYYALDGAVHYSSYLSKEYDVISVGVAGQSELDLQVSTYFQVKNRLKSKPLDINKLLQFDDYFNQIYCDPEKIKSDLSELKKYSKTLNDILRDDFDFEEAQRPLIVSGILLALEDSGFRASYNKKNKPKEIAELLLKTIEERLDRDNIGNKKQESMINTYGFLKSNTKIIQDRNKDASPNLLLKTLISDTESNIKPHSIKGTSF